MTLRTMMHRVLLCIVPGCTGTLLPLWFLASLRKPAAARGRSVLLLYCMAYGHFGFVLTDALCATTTLHLLGVMTDS